MVGFATEAATAGKPAIVGGYAWPFLTRTYLEGSLPPVEQCRPDSLTISIVRLAEDAALRQRLGQEARDFLDSRWSPKDIARRYLDVINGTLTEDFYFDPNRLDYVQGVGFPEATARDLVASVLSTGGRAALLLEDKPTLEQQFVDFAAQR